MVPGAAMRAGAAFAALEGAKQTLGIADYAVAQPTLEQVFVRTVLEHSEGERVNTRKAAKSVPELKDDSHVALLPRGSSLGEHSGRGSGVAALLASGAVGLSDAQVGLSGAQEAEEAEEFDLDTGVVKTWLGLDRRSHRWLGCGMGLFMYACYITIVTQRIGYVFFDFVVAWLFCMTGCVGCCCVISVDPDDADDE
jgi:hypothetical protein